MYVSFEGIFHYYSENLLQGSLLQSFYLQFSYLKFFSLQADSHCFNVLRVVDIRSLNSFRVLGIYVQLMAGHYWRLQEVY
jgi:hypothetical protein